MRASGRRLCAARAPPPAHPQRFARFALRHRAPYNKVSRPSVAASLPGAMPERRKWNAVDTTIQREKLKTTAGRLDACDSNRWLTFRAHGCQRVGTLGAESGCRVGWQVGIVARASLAAGYPEYN